MESKHVGVSVIYGIITILIVMLAGSLLVTLWIELVPPLIIQAFIFMVSLFAYLLGGFVAASMAKVHSVLVGALAATGVFGFTIVMQLTGYAVLPTGIQVLHWVLWVALGALGGYVSQQYWRGNDDETIEIGC